jgi:hypothetical protein
MEEQIYTSKNLADKFNCARITVLKWAEKNGVKYSGEGKRKIYLFTGEDIERFKNRPKPGRRWNKEDAAPPGSLSPGSPR